MKPSENESWLVEAGGDVIEKKAKVGLEKLSAAERLLYCFWVIDYCMRNAGDLVQVDLLHKNCIGEAMQLSKRLSLPVAEGAFALSVPELEAQYESRFEAV
jgi:hypothetical protein